MLGFEEILGDLVCPRGKAQGTIESLALVDGRLRSSRRSYPVIDGVPDLRMDEMGDTSYGVIHSQREVERRLEAVEDRMPALVESLDMRPDEINGARVLLAGAGGGVELALLSRFDPELIVAVDYSAYVRVLRASSGLFHPRTVFLQGDLCNLPFQEDSFDYVINSGVMHHTRSPELAFRNLHGVLRTGGTIVMGHIYAPNDHNRRITVARNRFGFHLMDSQAARDILAGQARRYTRACRWGLLKYLKRYPRLFGMKVELSGRNLTDYEQNMTSACDYYLCEYRHTITPEEVCSWYDHVGMTVERTAKGFRGRKPRPALAGD